MSTQLKYFFAILILLGNFALGQDVASYAVNSKIAIAHDLAFNGKHSAARNSALAFLKMNPENIEARALVARTYSWSRNYDKARNLFNTLTSEDKSNRGIWILAIKNELYAKNNATAFGLANKALKYLKGDSELLRLQKMAKERIINQSYAPKNWIDNPSSLNTQESEKRSKEPKVETKNPKVVDKKKEDVKKEGAEKKAYNNRIAIRNSFTVFDQRYDPAVFSTIEYKRQTQAGSLLPRINYSNRNGEHGVQYDLDFYPKFSKRFYAYLNYGYSNASIYPNHKVGGDLYVNLPGAMEFSAGGRYISLETKDISIITNSIGHYRGNYYFSLRTNLIPKEDNLIQFSGNLLIRKYLKDAHNYFSFNVGMGYSPELRQLISGDELLAETLLYIESQRMSLQYQFTAKHSPNVYSTSVGVSRRELAFQSGSFVWSVSAGLAYQVKF